MKYTNKKEICEYIKQNVKDRKFRYITFFWIIIAIQFVMGSNLQAKGYSIRNWTDFVISLLEVLGLSILFIIIHYCFLELYKKIKSKKTCKQKNVVKDNTKIEKYKWGIYFLIIIICWVPTLLAFYPAIISYDGGFQIRDYFFDGKAGHHPILITLLYTAFYSIGVKVKNVTFGMLLFSIFQMTFMATIFGYAVRTIEKMTKNKIIRNISLIFYALFPYNQLFSIITTKDVIFAGLFLIFIIKLYELFDDNYKIEDYIFFIIIGIITLLSRNNSVYTLEVSIPFLVIALIRNKKCMAKIVIAFLIIIISYKSINSGIYSIGNKQNDEGSLRIFAFSQAVAKLSRENEANLTEEEKEKISYYFTDYKKLAEVYKPAISDDSAKLINNSNVNKDKKEFFTFMYTLAKKYPRFFIDATLNTLRGFWYIQDNSFNTYNYDKYYGCMGTLELASFGIGKGDYRVKIYSKIPWLKNFDRKMFCENKYQDIPVLYIIFQPATYFYITIAYVLYSMYKKDKEKLSIGIVIFIYFISCFAAPTVTVRYMYAVIVCTPMMLASIFKKKDWNGKEENK